MYIIAVVLCSERGIHDHAVVFVFLNLVDDLFTILSPPSLRLALELAMVMVVETTWVE